jgi:uncharacterized membrane protein
MGTLPLFNYNYNINIILGIWISNLESEEEFVRII